MALVSQVPARCEVAGEVLLVLSPDGSISSFRTLLSRITQWSEAEWTGRPFYSFVHPDDIERTQEALKKAGQGKTLPLESVPCAAKSGKFVLFDLILVPRFYKGEVAGILCVGEAKSDDPKFQMVRVSRARSGGYSQSNDVPRSAPFSTELSGLLRLLETFLADSPIGFCFFDEKLRFVCINQTLACMNGYAPEQHLGRTPREITPETALRLESILRRVLKTGEPHLNFEVKFPGPANHSETQVGLANCYPVLGGTGNVIGIGTMVIDLTDRKRVEALNQKLALELTRSNEDLERFASIASHDLQEPVRMITSFLNLLGRRNEGKLDQESLEYLDFATDGAKRMHELVDGLLRYAKVGAKKPEMKKVDLNVILEKALMNLKVAIEESGAVVTRAILPEVRGDATQFVQLFQNLIANAIKYRRKDVQPDIHVMVQKRGKEWLIVVKDNGIGFETKDATRIFDVFHRLHTKSEYAGSGLGLATAKRVVERHSGRIWAESEVGKGSSFWFSIPAALKEEVS